MYISSEFLLHFLCIIGARQDILDATHRKEVDTPQQHFIYAAFFASSATFRNQCLAPHGSQCGA